MELSKELRNEVEALARSLPKILAENEGAGEPVDWTYDYPGPYGVFDSKEPDVTDLFTDSELYLLEREREAENASALDTELIRVFFRVYFPALRKWEIENPTLAIPAILEAEFAALEPEFRAALERY